VQAVCQAQTLKRSASVSGLDGRAMTPPLESASWICFLTTPGWEATLRPRRQSSAPKAVPADKGQAAEASTRFRPAPLAW
jgi:hypothetical protein